MTLIALIALGLAVFALVSARGAKERANELGEQLKLVWRELENLRRQQARHSERSEEPGPAAAQQEPPAAAPVPETPPAPPSPPPPPPVQVPHSVRDDTPRAIPIYRPPQPAAARAWSIDWESIIGVKLFSWIAGIALVLAAVFLFKYSVEHGWLRPPIRAGIGLATGIALLVVCEMRVARNYKFTANAMDGAGIAILYATLFAMSSVWQLIPTGASFFGMLLVTAAAVFLSTRRDSVFIALLGLVGGFATPALLSTGENRPIALFGYLLLLNGGISWIAFRKRWPLLTALSIALTVFYQWAWVDKYLTSGQLPLAAGIFAVFAIVGASALWPREGEGDVKQPLFRRIAAAAAVLPLIFAFFTAVVPEYGAHFNILFGFLLLMAGGLTATAILRGPRWLHSVGAGAVLVVWFVWLTSSYTHASWPWSLVWLAVFIALYLAAHVRLQNDLIVTAGMLFYVFIGLAIREPARDFKIIGAMLALLAIVMAATIRFGRPLVGALAIVSSSIATMIMDPGLRVELLVQAILLCAMLAIAWITGRHVLALLAIPFYVAAIAAADLPTADSRLLFAGALYAIFIAYPLALGARAKQSLLPHLTAALASLVFFTIGYYALEDMYLGDWDGVFAVALGLVLVLLVWRLLHIERNDTRLALMAGGALAFFTAAIPLTFEREWITVGLALEAAALAWLFSRIPHRGLLLWSGLLATAVLIRLVFNPAVFEYHPKSPTPLFNWYLYIYLVCAAAMFVASRLAPRAEPALRGFFVAAGAIELFFLLNIEIADYYSVGDTLTFNFMGSSLAQDLTYTMGWALFAIAVLVAGLVLQSRGARVAALGLLLVTILKCFLHDLARLGGLYRVASLFGLAVSLVAVGLMLQKFVMMKRESAPPTADA
jgi:uncharacterized membrane protein